MSEEELEDLLGIGCCEYHIEIGKEAKKEIERLKENNQAMQEEMVRTWKKLDEKESKIKEVREYIESHREAVDERGEHIIYFLKDDFDEEDILKILDKDSD